MADGIYVSMNGAAARAEQLEAIADNLANAQTPGFKAARPAFESFLAASQPGKEAEKTYTQAVSTGFDLSPGAVVQTGEPLDVLPNDNAFLAVFTNDGVAFTRNGKLQVDAEGRITIGGRAVLDKQLQPLVAPAGQTVVVEPNGQVRAGDAVVGELGLAQLSGPMNRVGPSLLKPQVASQAQWVDPGVRVGATESGNASPLEAAVQLVSVQRHFETSMQALQTYKRMDDRANELGKIR